MPDPDNLLADLRTAHGQLLSVLGERKHRGVLFEAARMLAIRLRSLDEWLSQGGNLPAAWSPRPPDVSVNGRTEPRPAQTTARCEIRYTPNASTLSPGIIAHCDEHQWRVVIEPGHTLPDLERLERQHRGEPA